MGLFDKKVCDICGAQLGRFFGVKKLADGNCCKECEGKLSPWFRERKQSTVEEIRAQIAYREENFEKVQAFHATRTLGQGTVVCLDEDKCQFMVMRTNNKESENPDVMDFSQITGVDLVISEDVYTDEPTQEEGKPAKLPRQYYDYSFKIVIQVDHPYFNEISFPLSTSDVRIESIAANVRNNGFVRETVKVPAKTGNAASAVAAKTAAAKNSVQGKRPAAAPAAPTTRTVMKPATPTVTFQKVDPSTNADYVRYKRTGTEIKRALIAAQNKVRMQEAAAAAPKKAVLCPFCGASTIPDANGACEYCGGPLG